MHHPKTARIRCRLNLPTLSSEDKFHAQLNVARVVPLRRHQSKCCGIARIQADAVAKVGVIKSIDGFGAKLQLRVFSELKVLRDRQVHVQEGLVAQAVERRRNVAQAGVEVVKPDDPGTVNEWNLKS